MNGDSFPDWDSVTKKIPGSEKENSPLAVIRRALTDHKAENSPYSVIDQELEKLIDNLRAEFQSLDKGAS